MLNEPAAKRDRTYLELGSILWSGRRSFIVNVVIVGEAPFTAVVFNPCVAAGYSCVVLAVEDVRWVVHLGLDVVLAVMAGLFEEWGDDRYRPTPLLRRMVLAGQLGEKSGRGFCDNDHHEPA